MSIVRPYLWFMVVALFFTLSSPAWAANIPRVYTGEELQAIGSAQTCIRGAEQLLQIGTITAPQKADSISQCLTHLNTKLGMKLSVSEVLSIPTGSVTNLTALQHAAGYLTLHNTFWFFVVIGLTVSVCVLFWRLAILLVYIPKSVYEVSCYSVGSFFIYGAVLEPVSQMQALLGTLLIGGGLILSKVRIKDKFRRAEIVIPGIMAAVFAVTTVLTSGSIIGYFAVASLLTALGFSVIVVPGLYILGYQDDNLLARGTIASFLLLIVTAIVTMTGKVVVYLIPFTAGIWLIAGIVGYLGLLIITNRWFWLRSAGDRQVGYFTFQGIMVIACVLGLWFGSVYQVTEVHKIAGTFLVLWALEKPFEIKAVHKTYYAAAGTVVFGLLYWICSSRPQWLQTIMPF